MSRPIKVRSDWEKAKWIYAHPWRYLRAKNIDRLRRERSNHEYLETILADPVYDKEFNRQFDKEWNEMTKPKGIPFRTFYRQ